MPVAIRFRHRPADRSGFPHYHPIAASLADHLRFLGHPIHVVDSPVRPLRFDEGKPAFNEKYLQCLPENVGTLVIWAADFAVSGTHGMVNQVCLNNAIAEALSDKHASGVIVIWRKDLGPVYARELVYFVEDSYSTPVSFLASEIAALLSTAA